MPLRPYALPNGTMDWRLLPYCDCAAPRGPQGGCCGRCGGAIDDVVARDRTREPLSPGTLPPAPHLDPDGEAS